MSLHGHARLPPPLTPPHKGEGDLGTTAATLLPALATCVSASPSPLWGGVRGGGATRAGARHPTAGPKLPISPLEGEMAGRPEGGRSRHAPPAGARP